MKCWTKGLFRINLQNILKIYKIDYCFRAVYFKDQRLQAIYCRYFPVFLEHMFDRTHVNACIIYRMAGLLYRVIAADLESILKMHINLSHTTSVFL